MQLIQKLLDHALKESVLLEESRQVIAYAMLHPMYENNPNDRATLNQYSQQVIILISNYIVLLLMILTRRLSEMTPYSMINFLKNILRSKSFKMSLI